MLDAVEADALPVQGDEVDGKIGEVWIADCACLQSLDHFFQLVRDEEVLNAHVRVPALCGQAAEEVAVFFRKIGSSCTRHERSG